ncbi:MAG: DUF2244 domain-containing protein [Gammaproteobacteria bacterium]|nr:DUF2244 domain-containing protein [Gammaproteobacteria bacterium]NNF62244.1 DUF2244 domain-containing protein [Gammaproteobacteria bacterium]NNM21041.1 DUF2244 domain-containing protein [Gammaproteobacteria bacterium]
MQVTPNCSLSWRAAVIFYLWVCTASLGIALVFVWLGYWPVLPFAGLEMMVLGVALWLSLHRGSYREVISIFPDRIEVARGRTRQRECTVFPLHWARVNLRPTRLASYPSRLVISSHGRSCEIGRCLTESERIGLGRRLDELIGTTAHTPDRWQEVAKPGNAHR